MGVVVLSVVIVFNLVLMVVETDINQHGEEIPSWINGLNNAWG